LIPLRKVSGLSFHTRQFLLPKRGYDASECEDAIGIDNGSRRFAIADGATEAFFARNWAGRLASNWVKKSAGLLTPEEFRSWVGVEGQTLHDSWNELSLAWYAEEKARTGSFAAFVGLQLELEVEPPRWSAIALGDACLFHLRNGEINQALPLMRSEDFNAAPVLVPSDSTVLETAWEKTVVASGEVEPDDSFVLLSDAAAAWYLMLVETKDEGRFRFDKLLTADRKSDLVKLFDEERDAGRIKNDDIAIVRIDVHDSNLRRIFRW
jgi:hypothetical protein